MKKIAPTPISDAAKAYELAIYIRYYELEQTMARNNFFMVFQGVALAGTFALISKENMLFWPTLAAMFLGVVLSYFQIMMACAGRYEIIQSTHDLQARELDLLALIPNDEKRFYFFTRPNADPFSNPYIYKVENSLVSYSQVAPIWEKAGLKRNPLKPERGLSDDCSLIGRLIMKKGHPSVIAIWVAVVLFLFWLIMLLALVMPRVKLFFEGGF